MTPIVCVPKKDEGTRICVDMRETNKAIITLDDFKAEVNDAKHFLKIDLKQAYHQVELFPESRFITTFEHMRVYKNIADDIIFGKERKEHDTALANCIQRLSNLNMKAKDPKFHFLQPEIKFYGLIFTAKGTRPDPERVTNFPWASA